MIPEKFADLKQELKALMNCLLTKMSKQDGLSFASWIPTLYTRLSSSTLPAVSMMVSITCG